jgi:hypothetical protein
MRRWLILLAALLLAIMLPYSVKAREWRPACALAQIAGLEALDGAGTNACTDVIAGVSNRSF